MSNISVTTNQQVIDVTNTSGITVTTPEGQTIDVIVPNSSVSVTNTTDDITILTSGTLNINSSGVITSVNGNTGPIVVLDTDDISEGSTNQYFTTARARTSISVTDSGGDGSLSYDNSTGVITYTGPSATEIRSHFTAGTGVSITNGQISIGQSVATTDAVSFNTITLNTSTGALKRSDGSTLITYSSGNDSLGNAYKDVQFGGAGISTSYVNIDGRILLNSAILTTTTTTANQLLDSFNKNTYRAANYLIHISAAGEYQMWEGMIIHNGTNAYLNAYGDLRTSVDNLATITAGISGNIVEIRVTPTNAATTFKIQKTLMNV